MACLVHALRASRRGPRDRSALANKRLPPGTGASAINFNCFTCVSQTDFKLAQMIPSPRKAVVQGLSDAPAARFPPSEKQSQPLTEVTTAITGGSLPDPLEIESLMLNIDASLRVHARPQFFTWTQGLLQNLIKHELLVCALRDRKSVVQGTTAGLRWQRLMIIQR